jgi:hypothetical protein
MVATRGSTTGTRAAPVGVGQVEASRAELPAEQSVLGNQVGEGLTIVVLQPTSKDQK